MGVWIWTNREQTLAARDEAMMSFHFELEFGRADLTLAFTNTTRGACCLCFMSLARTHSITHPSFLTCRRNGSNELPHPGRPWRQNVEVWPERGTQWARSKFEFEQNIPKKICAYGCVLSEFVKNSKNPAWWLFIAECPTLELSSSNLHGNAC